MLQNRVFGEGLSANGAIGKNIAFDVHAVFSRRRSFGLRELPRHGQSEQSKRQMRFF
jgi:hypothetical protein